MEKNRRIVIVGLVLLLTWSFQVKVHGQCDPVQLCGEADAISSEIEPNPMNYDCMDVQNSNIYYFTTNSDADQAGGDATIDVYGVSCVDSTGAAIPVQVMIVGPFLSSGAIDCTNTTNWNSLGCVQDTVNMVIDAENLGSNESYAVIVGYNPENGSDPCDINVGVSGSAVDIQACCDSEISLGESYSFETFGGSGTYAWNTPSYLDDQTIGNPTSFPEETIEYTVTSTIDGCEVTDIVTLIVLPPLNVPNTITPNGDTYNDVWEIFGIQKFENAQVNVYDRWGQLVFKTVGYAQPWDGTRNGKFLPTATYYYVIELNSLDVQSDPITGSITIVH